MVLHTRTLQVHSVGSTYRLSFHRRTHTRPCKINAALPATPTNLEAQELPALPVDLVSHVEFESTSTD